MRIIMFSIFSIFVVCFKKVCLHILLTNAKNLNVIKLPSFWKYCVKSTMFKPLTTFLCFSEEMSILIVHFLNVKKFWHCRYVSIGMVNKVSSYVLLSQNYLLTYYNDEKVEIINILNKIFRTIEKYFFCY